MNLLDAIAAAVPPAEPITRPRKTLWAAPSGTRGASSPTPSLKPVLQFGLTPVALDLKRFADARSSSRPDGGLAPLVAFRNLIDPLPSFTRFYESSGKSTELLYESILDGATVGADNPFVTKLLDHARKQFNANAFVNMDGTAGNWHPIYAIPEDWHDLSIDGRFQDLAVDLTDLGAGGGPYQMIGDPAPLGLTIGVPANVTTPLDPRTTIRSFRMKYLLVWFNRPWFMYELFQTGGWWLSQQRSGYCSSGDLQANPGVFPLLPTGMLLGKDVALDVTWGRTDQARLSSELPPGAQISLGPFRLDLSAPTTDVQIVGWISSLVPFSPSLPKIRHS